MPDVMNAAVPLSPARPDAGRLPSLRHGAGLLMLAALTALGGCAAPRAPGPRQAPPPERAVEPMYFYPERGQSESLQDRDRYECYRWAVRQTGVDPGMQPVQRSAAPEVEPVRRSGEGAVAGAATGAVVGAMMSPPRHGGPSMVIGAIFGGLLGAAAEESRAQADEQRQLQRRREWEARQQPAQDFRRAMSACMSGRGYTVR